jgi:heme-degrading monooxygenase HmoA
MSPPFPKRTFPMFARIVDFVSRPGKTRTLNETIQSRLFAILRVQPGFVDEIVLESDVEPNRVVTLSFWRTREQAEHAITRKHTLRSRRCWLPRLRLSPL